MRPNLIVKFLHPTAHAYLGPKGLAGVLAIAVLVACSQDVADVPAAESNPLFIDPETFGFESNPELLERVLSSPHGYFRLINIPFSQEVCRT